MAGTIAGGKRAAETNKRKYGSDWYARIGQMGGRNGHTGGFAANPELAKVAGAKGGVKSKRGRAKALNQANIEERFSKCKTISELERAYHLICSKNDSFKWMDFIDETYCQYKKIIKAETELS